MVKRFIPVENHPSLYRDSRTGAILNTSEIERKRYISQKEKLSKSKQEQTDINNRIAVLESRVNSMDSKLDAILNVLNGIKEK